MADEVIDVGWAKFLIDPRDLIGSTLKAGTVWDGPGFLQVIARDYAIGKAGTVIDVGANQGVWTIWLAQQGVRVVAVEPVPEVVLRLKANLDLNKASCAEKVIVVPKAAYGYRCPLTAAPVDPGNLGGTALLPPELRRRYQPPCPEDPIQAIALDSLAPLWESTGVSLIKIDAQGCDGQVLRGLRETLARWHPVVVFEWEARLAPVHQVSLVETLTLLTNLGYRVIEWPSHPDNYLAVWQAQS